MRSTLTALAAAALVALLLVPVAAADKPIKEPLPSGSFVLEDACGFPVLVEFGEPMNKEQALLFPADDGGLLVLITGAFRVRITNLNEPSNSSVVNVPGPGKDSYSSDGAEVLMAVGPWIWGFEPGELSEDDPGGLFLTTGLVWFTFTADGVGSIDQVGGTRTDLCAVIA
jgi:hypothetical protein